jgi:hypothetical protein
VYVSLPGVGEQSSLVKSSGSWAIPLSNARTTDGSGYATIQDTDQLTINVQGVLAAQTLQAQVPVSSAQPVATLTFGQSGTLAGAPQTTATDTTEVEPSPTPEATPETISEEDNATPAPVATGGLTNLVTATPIPTASGSGTASSSATRQSTASASAAVTTVDLTKTTTIQEVTTGQPVIRGVAAPNAKITIVIHSETEINYELVADANGGFVIDVSKLENDPTLEPGEHTITYSYVDPQTGREVTKTQTFMVKAPASSTTSTTSTSSQQLALANTSNNNELELGTNQHFFHQD